MNQYFVDTNIFLRFLLADSPKQYQLSKKLFEKSEQNKISLWTTDIVILELVWTLKSFYKLPIGEIRDKISSLIVLKNLEVENKEILLKALDEFIQRGVDFADAYNFFLAQKALKKIVSFDKDFDKLGKREDLEKLVKS